MTEDAKKAATPAWKLRQSMKGDQPSTLAQTKTATDVQAKLKKKMEKAALDPNLPAAFKVANVGRLAFSKQQERRRNNDTFQSLNSSHPAPKQQANASQDDDDDDSVDISSDSEGSFE
jgi:hypothetical protein